MAIIPQATAMPSSLELQCQVRATAQSGLPNLAKMVQPVPYSVENGHMHFGPGHTQSSRTPGMVCDMAGTRHQAYDICSSTLTTSIEARLGYQHQPSAPDSQSEAFQHQFMVCLHQPNAMHPKPSVGSEHRSRQNSFTCAPNSRSSNFVASLPFWHQCPSEKQGHRWPTSPPTNDACKDPAIAPASQLSAVFEYRTLSSFTCASNTRSSNVDASMQFWLQPLFEKQQIPHPAQQVQSKCPLILAFVSNSLSEEHIDSIQPVNCGSSLLCDNFGPNSKYRVVSPLLLEAVGCFRDFAYVCQRHRGLIHFI